MSERTRTIVVSSLCGLLFSFCAACAALVVAGHVRELRTFRPVEATILESAVRDGPGRGANFYPHVRFAYIVDGTSYVSSTYGSGGWTSEREEKPRAIAARYAVGTRHTAWYDPAEPARAVLVRELDWLALALALLGCLLPTALLIVHRRTRLRSAAPTLPG